MPSVKHNVAPCWRKCDECAHTLGLNSAPRHSEQTARRVNEQIGELMATKRRLQQPNNKRSEVSRDVAAVNACVGNRFAHPYTPEHQGKSNGEQCPLAGECRFCVVYSGTQRRDRREKCRISVSNKRCSGFVSQIPERCVAGGSCDFLFDSSS